jgi:hypothetical protein
MRAAGEALHQTGARPVRAAWARPVTGEASPAGPATGRAPLFPRARMVRAVLTAALAAAGVGLSALAFSALWPAGETVRRPAPLSSADAVAARSLVARAQELVSATPAELGYRLRVAGPVEGVRGQADAATITLFVSPQMQPHQVAHDLAHEIGHAFDAQRLSVAQRAAYLRARGVPDAPWWPGREASDYRSGAGDFAEVFALCRATSPEFRSRLAARPQDPCGLLPKQARGAKLGGGGS